jgi:hypothetical protein
MVFVLHLTLVSQAVVSTTVMNGTHPAGDAAAQS